MKKKLTTLLFQCLALLTGLLFAETTVAQLGYNTRVDPKNLKRKIIDLPKIVKKATPISPTKNTLDAVSFKRPPIAYKAFEMKNPKTGNALNPSAVVTFKMPDGKTRKTTVKQFFDELNEMEKALASRGRTLRVPSTFTDLKPNFNRNSYSKVPKLNTGFQTTRFKSNNFAYNKNPGPIILKNTSGIQNTNINPGTIKTGNTSGTLSSNSNSGPVRQGNKNATPIILNPGIVLTNNWKANLYIALRFENHGQPEFPAEWVDQTLNSKGRSIYPIIVQVPKAVASSVKRIDWQVSDKPFVGTLKDINVPGIKKTGTLSPVTWAPFFKGTTSLPNNQNYKYADLYIDLQQIAPEPVNQIKPYYIRAICYNQAGEIMNITPQVIANYGGLEQKFAVAVPEENFVPGFQYQFPDAGTDLPFGVFIKGSGFQSKKGKKYFNENYDELVTTGYRISADASLGVKYFNFLSLVDGAQPMSKELTLVKGDFRAALGLGTGPTGGNEEQGVKLKLSFLDGLIPYEIGFSQEIPGVPNTISLEYDVTEEIDMGLLDMRFMIGPIPIHIYAAIKGQAGIKLFGQANTSSFEVSGGIMPFMETRFEALGGVDALIAYATLNAEVNPLLAISMPMTFSSSGATPLSFSTNVSGLSGRVYLKVGFWYPCPDLEKIVGWLTGDEATPLCECKWEYNIFDFSGFNHTYTY